MAIDSNQRRKKIIQDLHHVPSLQKTATRMLADGKIDKEKEEYINSHIEGWVAESKYILLNLGIHISMGLVRFTAIPLPIPVGSTMRVLWVMANRMYCNLKRDMDRKKIHSLPVLFFAAIPFLGYLAYIIPLKKKSEFLAYLYAEHVSYMLYNKTLEDKLTKAPGFIKKIAYALLIPR